MCTGYHPACWGDEYAMPFSRHVCQCRKVGSFDAVPRIVHIADDDGPGNPSRSAAITRKNQRFIEAFIMIIPQALAEHANTGDGRAIQPCRCTWIYKAPIVRLIGGRAPSLPGEVRAPGHVIGVEVGVDALCTSAITSRCHRPALPVLTAPRILEAPCVSGASRDRALLRNSQQWLHQEQPPRNCASKSQPCGRMTEDKRCWKLHFRDNAERRPVRCCNRHLCQRSTPS